MLVAINKFVSAS